MCDGLAARQFLVAEEQRTQRYPVFRAVMQGALQHPSGACRVWPVARHSPLDAFMSRWVAHFFCSFDVICVWHSSPPFFLTSFCNFFLLCPHIIFFD